MPDHNCILGLTPAEARKMMTDIAVTSTNVKDIKSRMDKQDKKIETHERAIGKLENWRFWIMGILVATIGIVTFLLKYT